MITANSHPIPSSGNLRSTSNPKTGNTRIDRDHPPPSKFELANVVVSQASIVLPFDCRTAYFAFSDFTRHATWNPSLTKVEYINSKGDEVRWTMESGGIQFGWSTVATRKEPNKLLVWRSIKGLQLQGRAEFEPNEDGASTMLFTLTYVAPRKVKTCLEPPHKRESANLKLMLEAFREDVRKECETNNNSNNN